MTDAGIYVAASISTVTAMSALGGDPVLGAVSE